MGKSRPPRHGSLQFYPRVRAKKLLHRVKWNSVKRDKSNLMGFICYKVSMASAYVKDNTPHSISKGQKIIIPITILECPTLKILSVRFYKNSKVLCEVLNDNIDKELKNKVKLPKTTSVFKQKIEEIEKKGDFDDIKVIAYSQVKKTSIKATPDISEIGISGTLNEKIEFIKSNIGKEISIKNVFNEGTVDIRGVTTGKGFNGIVKRFGVTLKQHKTEKGIRSLGSGGPWHPARVTFHEPRAGQLGFFSRLIHNVKIIGTGNILDKDINPNGGFRHYGKIKSEYIMLYGSVIGPSKRQLLLTSPLRENKKVNKRNFEVIEIR